jgi:hypothetical protein
MMRTRIQHFLIVESGTSPLKYYAMRRFGAEQPTPADKLRQFAHLRKARKVDWEQTFALKGLSHAAYAPRAPSSRGLYVFDKKPTVATAGPVVVTFKREPKSEQSLQGDVLTVVSEELALPVVVQLECVVEVADKYLAMLGKNPHHTCREWVQEAAQSVTSPNERASLEAVLKEWAPSRSFLRVTPI